MTDPRALASALAPELPSMLTMIERAVSIDSGTYHAAGVNAVIDVFAEFLAGMGFAIERMPLPGRGDQLTARRALGNGKRLLVLGHADTVWPAGTVTDWPFANDGTFLTGPGVGDMKSCVVMALHALRVLLKEPLPGIGTITVLIVPDEEIGSPGSRAWIEQEARQSDVCLTLEPCRPGGKVVVGRGAVGALYVRATGVTAHVGPSRALGASAISALAPMAAALEALTDPERGVGTSVGIFRGGAARQVVPAEAEIHLDLRATDQAGSEWLLAEVRRIAQTPPADPRVRISVEGGFYRPPFPTRAGTRSLYAMAQRVGEAIGTPVEEVVSPGGSDGSFAAAMGIATLDGLGPICHESCSRRERVEVGSIVPRGALFAGLVHAIGSEGVS